MQKIDRMGGRLLLRFEGANVERLLNRASAAGIRLEHIQRSESSVTCWVSLDDFYRMRGTIRRLRLRTRILEKHGLPMLRIRLRRRRGWAIGLCVALLLFLVAITRIWAIDVEGLQDLSREEILGSIAAQGVGIGSYSRDIDCAEVENAIRAEFPELAWVSVSITGVRMRVQMSQSVRPPEVLDRSDACDIVAAKPGVIARITVLEGKALVRAGDVVTQGQVLVRGIDTPLAATPRPEDPKSGVYREVHARGDIQARVFYTASTQVKLTKEERRPTGRRSVRRTLYLLGWPVPLSQGAPYDEYDVETHENYIMGESFLPVKVLSEVLSEVEVHRLPREIAQAKREAEESAIAQALAKCPEDAAVIDKRVEFSMIQGDTLLATAYLETLEDIGQEQKP